jgi:hypothetical protein
LIEAKPSTGEILTLESRGNSSAALCSHCDLPFLTIKDGNLLLQAKHGSAKHENTLTIEHLRLLLFEMYRQTHPPEFW